jgi:hypothetical protein
MGQRGERLEADRRSSPDAIRLAAPSQLDRAPRLIRLLGRAPRGDKDFAVDAASRWTPTTCLTSVWSAIPTPITAAGEATNGRFCMIDMHVPPGAGHRHTGMTSRRRLFWYIQYVRPQRTIPHAG